MKYLIAVLLVLGLGLWGGTGCNVSGEDETEAPDCVADAECDNGYCLEEECVGCVDDGHCSEGVCFENNCVSCRDDDDCAGTDICEGFQCLSGCEELHCGAGGSCVDDGDELYCDCDEGYFDSGDQCEACDCEIENGIGACDENGECYVVECDDDYIDSGDQCLSCDCEVENGEGACDEDNQCYIVECDEGYSTEDDDPITGCECAATDTPDPVDFVDENCDGLDGDMSTAIFVSTFGDNDHDGDPNRPVRTVQRGIDLANNSSGHDSVFIAQGEYEEAIRIEESVNLYGGYIDLGGGEWDRDASDSTTINGQDVSDGHRPVEITGIDDDMEIQLLTIRADDATTDTVDGQSVAGSSVGISLYDNDGHVDIEHSLVVAESGADGADGTANDGATGADGEGTDSSPGDNEGRSGATTTCSYSENTYGGDGGDGGTPSQRDGAPGSSGSGAQGGSGGSGGSTQCSNSPDWDVLAGDDGAGGGAGGQAGSDAGTTPSTTALSAPQSSQSLVLYQGQDGDDGEDGTSGASGGGGGGMGYLQVNLPVAGCENEWDDSPGGAGGGAGGCGGEGGGGGKSGGASVAIMSYASSISVSHTELRTDVGGDGGNGHPGGSGGAGGDGGEPAEHEDGSTAMGGGDGMAGGDGGGGSGGEGGASVGILYDNSSVETDEVDFDLRRGGFGGDGGTSAGDGPDGIEAEIHDF